MHRTPRQEQQTRRNPRAANRSGAEPAAVQQRRRSERNYAENSPELYNNTQDMLRNEEQYIPQAQHRRFRQPVTDEPPVLTAGQLQRARRKRAARVVCGVVILLCMLCIAALGLFVAPQLLGVRYTSMPNYGFVNGSIISLDDSDYATYRTYRQYMAGNTIFPGVYVDGIDLGGMTLEQAHAAVNGVGATNGADFQIKVNVGNKTWSIDSGMVPMSRDANDVLMQAYAYGRQNSMANRNTGLTPYYERLNAALNLRQAPVGLYTTLSYDRSILRAMTDSIVNYVNRDPVNASVATFDFNTKSFTFNSDTPGAWIDADSLYNQVITCLDSGNYHTSITVEPDMILAPVTKAELMNSFKLISKYTTKTTSDSRNRDINVDLSAKAINGRTVLPGEVFSFNEATGQRTAAKGYREANAIAGGQSVPEIGGGVCQTSSTLFNAVVRANLEIVERSPHAWPSSYVEKGMDATVNWPNLDFKFRNNTDWPIFIVSYFKNNKVTVEVYGMSLGDGVTIDLESEVTQTIKPSKEIKYVYNEELPPGTEKKTISARTGYVVETYKVWYQNGKEIGREHLHTSKYKMYQETVEYH